MAPKSDHKTTTAEDALSDLRAAIEHHRREAADNIDDLRTTLTNFCAQARREQMAPEQVLVAVKTALDWLPFDRADEFGFRDSIRTRAVSLAIRSYYASDWTSDGEIPTHDHGH